MSVLLQIAATTTDPVRPLGIGPGLLTLIILGIIFVIAVVIGQRIGKLAVMLGIFGGIWVLIALILFLTPKLPQEQIAQQAKQVGDTVTVVRVIFAVLFGLSMLGAIGAWIGLVAVPPVYAVKPQVRATGMT